MKHYFLIFFSLFLLILSSGCSKEYRLQGLVPCEGMVTFDGKPLEGATVSFDPVGGYADKHRGAAALTGADGSFKAMTLQPRDGIYPGDYVVMVMKAYIKDPDGAATTVFLTPVKYADSKKSGFSATISNKGEKNLVFELSSKK